VQGYTIGKQSEAVVAAAAVDETVEGIVRTVVQEMVAAASEPALGAVDCVYQYSNGEVSFAAEAQDDDIEKDQEDLVLLSAKVLSLSINYPHLSFGELVNIRAELEGEEAAVKAAALKATITALTRADVGGRTIGKQAEAAAAALDFPSPVQAVADGLWVQTLLKVKPKP
jgi:hypothetical protein